ncbi:hypothetical protein MMC22_007012 [Lobaria immixta]|nr:hypothetical protein [Lobaria immixta]
MPKRKREGLELENGSNLKKLKTHEMEKDKLVPKQQHINAVALQPKSNKKPRTVVNAKANSFYRDLRKKRRKDRIEHGKQSIDDIQEIDGEPSGSADVQGSQQKPMKIRKAKWKFSGIVGGRMLDLDPIFTPNEEYLLLPYDTAINVYATSTSLLVRRLQLSRAHPVSAFALSSINTNHLFISTNSGSIEKWDWLEGTRLEYWDISATIYSLATSMPVHTEKSNGLVYTVDRKDEGQWKFTVHRLLGGSEASKTDLGTLLKYGEPLKFVKILDNGRIVVITSGSRVIIGTCDRPSPDSLKDLSYTWRDVDCPEWITSIDVQMRPYDTTMKKPKPSKKSFHGAVDIVVGTLRGKIIVYDDLLGNLIRVERGTTAQQVDSISSRRLHWHRSAVLTLKWSLDGNYIISGGSETVLVIWQLETGQEQVLPHLSAPIESIVVSPSGSSYGVRLSDNSAMILSTSELQPTFSVAGIQLPVARKAAIPVPFIPNVDAPFAGSTPQHKSCLPAVVSPSDPSHLLLAVPSFTASGLNPRVPTSSCYLQTFNITSAHQVAKQALTRTKDTILSIGPKQNLIEEPRVIHMRISHDARWLATIDEWLPPRGDVTFLAFDKEREAEEQLLRREIHLKIWLWNDQLGIWELSSRIDNPHSSQSSITSDSRAVLALASDPSCASFATVGANNELRIWKPSIRRRNGIEVRAKDGRPLMNWRCRHVTLLEDSNIVGKGNHKGANLAYSLDGSVLAAGYRLSTSSTIYLINSSTGTVQRTLTCMYTGPLLGLEIVDRYLIVLSSELRVWDLVAEEVSFGFKLKPNGLTLEKRVTITHLAADAKGGTFAVSLPENRKTSKHTTKLRSRLFIFDPKTPKSLYESSVSNTSVALVPAAGRKAYYVIDSEAQVRVVSSSPSMFTPSGSALVDNESSPRGLENIYGTKDGAKADAIGKVDDEDVPKMEFSRVDVLLSTEKDEAAVVSQDKLAEIFDTGSAFTLPPTTELFEQVAHLFLGKQP